MRLVSVIGIILATPALCQTAAPIFDANAAAAIGADSSEVDVISAYRQDRPPVTKPGDLWVLGRYKLLCGDARDEKGYSRNGGSHFHGFAVQRAHRWSCLRL